MTLIWPPKPNSFGQPGFSSLTTPVAMSAKAAVLIVSSMADAIENAIHFFICDFLLNGSVLSDSTVVFFPDFGFQKCLPLEVLHALLTSVAIIYVLAPFCKRVSRGNF